MESVGLLGGGGLFVLDKYHSSSNCNNAVQIILNYFFKLYVATYLGEQWTLWKLVWKLAAEMKPLLMEKEDKEKEGINKQIE